MTFFSVFLVRGKSEKIESIDFAESSGPRSRLKYSAIEGPCVLILTELDLGRPKNGLSLLVILLILVFSQNFLKKIF